MVPEITLAPEINLRACFLDYAYKSEVCVTSNEFWGYFTLVEPEVRLHLTKSVEFSYVGNEFKFWRIHLICRRF